MNHSPRLRKGFTLIELLVVVLILGILVAVALPSYVSASLGAKANAADANARTLATAIKSEGVKLLGLSSTALSDAIVLTDAGGTIPNNPCSASTGAAGYTYTYSSALSATLVAKSDTCAGYAPKTFVIKL